MRQTDRLIRKITLALAPGCHSEAVMPLRQPEGILDLRAEGHGRIAVVYDLRHATLSAIESWLAANGLRLSGSIPARLHRRWRAFKDDNRRDQAAIVHQCCSVPPRKE